jgi:hypothetical protein
VREDRIDRVGQRFTPRKRKANLALDRAVCRLGVVELNVACGEVSWRQQHGRDGSSAAR